MCSTMIYPIIQVLQDYTSLVSLEETSLEQLSKVPVNGYLMELVSGLNDFQNCVNSIMASVEGEDFVQENTDWKPSMKEALVFLFKFFCQINKLLEGLEQKLASCPDINNENLQCLRQFKQNMSEFSCCLDQITRYYSDMGLVTELPPLEEVKDHIAKLQKNIDLVKSQPWFEFVGNTQTSPEEVICLILGLQTSLARRLASLEPEIRSHQSDKYFLLVFLAENYESCGTDGKLTDKEGVAARLCKMGFTANRSEVIAKWIAEQSLCQHQSILTWAELYITTVFEYNIFLSECVTRYPYDQERIQEWIEVPISWETGNEDIESTVTTKVTLINTTPQLASEVIKTREDQVGSRLLFHATDHKAAVRIVDDGINLGAGGFKRDFSDGDGFYLTSDSKHAVTWATKVKTGAVILFKVSEHMLTRFQHLDLRSDQAAWKRIVKFNRNGRQRSGRLLKDLSDKYRRCDYILGPMCGNGAGCNDELWQPLGFGNGRPQVCVKSEHMAECISNRQNICGIVFMNTH